MNTYFEALNECVPVLVGVTIREKIDLFDRVVGPLQQHLTYDLPLFFALQLHESNSGVIKVPAWLEPLALSQVLERERGSSELAQINPFFVEISNRLLPIFRENEDTYGSATQRGAEVLTLMEHLRDELQAVRQSKIAKAMRQMSLDDTALNLTNVTAFELSEVTTTKEYLKLSVRLTEQLNEQYLSNK